MLPQYRKPRPGGQKNIRAASPGERARMFGCQITVGLACQCGYRIMVQTQFRTAGSAGKGNRKP